MKKILFVSLIVGCAAFSSVRAQVGAAQTNTAVPPSKIAVIFSEAFWDAKTGIARHAAAVESVNKEFQGAQNELNQTAQRLRALQEEISKMQQGTTPATPAQIQTKIEQLDQQKKEYQRKGEDAQANYKKRLSEVVGPVRLDVSKALDAFSQSKGIVMILDGSQTPLVYAADSIDITKAFIADYNSKNPATAAATPKH